jgi:elongation factor Ts
MSSPATPALIKELRDRTGVGMGKCKEALEEAKGDIELAIANLRKAGIASAVKKEGRSTNEGMIFTAETASTISIVEVNAETDFVVKNDRFQEFGANIAAEAAATKPASLEAFLAQHYSKDRTLTVDQYRATIIQTIGENIQIRRIKLIPKASNKSIGVYSHLGGKLLTLVEISGSPSEVVLAKDIAMHCAAAAPEFLSPDKVPVATIAHEKDIARSQIKGKPDNIVEKILEGKLNAYYDQACLVRQKYIKDDELTIAEVVAKRGKETGHPLAVTDFLRWNVGQSV